MDPTLETVLYSSTTVSFNVNKLSRRLPDADRLFSNKTMNGTIIFKYPNFDVSATNVVSNAGKNQTVHTAVFIPRNAEDLTVGGFGVFMDDSNFTDVIHRYVGLDANLPDAADDMEILRLLTHIPSLDPYILHDKFNESKIAVNPAYFEITSHERSFVRNMITDKVKPIVMKALGQESKKDFLGHLSKFIDAIWDPSLSEAELFIKAFGIKKNDVTEVFAAWKGITFYMHEFLERGERIRAFLDWLASKNSLPAEYGRLKRLEKEQVDMFRKSVGREIFAVQKNAQEIFQIYERSYKEFIDKSEPKHFRKFLFKAHDYYWTLGACNGVLAQVCTAWERYYKSNRVANYKLNNDELTRLLRVCDSLLKPHGNAKLGEM